MSGKKAKVQRKLEREKFGTDTVQFKRGRTAKIVAGRKVTADAKVLKAEQTRIEFERLQVLAKQRQVLSSHAKRIAAVELVSAAELAAVVGSPIPPKDGD